MYLILKDKIEIDIPMVFICGPFFQNKKNDKRKIFIDYLAKDYSFKVLPIIVDNFLGKEQIKDNTISIPLLEEICAAVSVKTYVFLDTFSSVSELGIFSSASTKNKILVLVPQERDKLVNNIGFFVREIFSSECNEDIDFMHYRPKITRVPLASDYVVEYYEFPYNELPKNIAENIDNDIVIRSYSRKLTLSNKSSIPSDIGEINYKKDKNEYEISLSLTLLFYIVVSIQKKANTNNMSIVTNYIYKTLTNTIALKLNLDSDDIRITSINTNIKNTIEEIVRHILKFAELFEEYGQYTGEQIITKSTAIIRKQNIFEYFSLVKEKKLIEEYIENPDKYVENIKIRTGRKSRDITKYREDDNGKRLRNIHEKILNKLQNIYRFSENSFAYKKKTSILNCVGKHKGSISFIKLDISSFFNSIRYRHLYTVLGEMFINEIDIDNDFHDFVKLFLYKNRVPLGLVTSPIISDIYLKSFDINISEYIKNNLPGLVFTRYADDMFFSSNSVIDSELIENLVREELEKKELLINEKKTIYIDLNKEGSYVKMLGLNIVKTSADNTITVGKKYINDTAKAYLKYIEEKRKNEFKEKDKFYQEKRISGRIAFIRQVEGDEGYSKLKKRILKSTEGRVEISDEGINFN